MNLDGGDVAVPVTVHAPVDRKDHWRCDFTIGWPQRTRHGQANVIDAVQALMTALQVIGMELYASEAHKTGALKWHETGSGYGFPIHPTVRDGSVGLDKLL